VHVKCTGITHIRGLPDPLHEQTAAEHLARLKEELFDQQRQFRRQRRFLRMRRQHTTAEIELEWADAQNPFGRTRAVFRRSDQSGYGIQHAARRHGTRDDRVGSTFSCCITKQQNRHLRQGRFELLGNPVARRAHRDCVDNDERGLLCSRGAERLFPTGSNRDGETFSQGFPKGIMPGTVAFDEDDGRHCHRPLTARARCWIPTGLYRCQKRIQNDPIRETVILRYSIPHCPVVRKITPVVTRSSIGLTSNAIRQLADWTLNQALAIQAIPAPTFGEADRARYVAQQFEQIGLSDVFIDDIQNVYGVLPGRARPGIALSAHTDTVFDLHTPLTTHRDGDLIYGPGLGDNSIGVAGLLAAAASLAEADNRPCDIRFIATSGEEGLGNLRGMRTAFERIRPAIGCVINIEGLALGHIYNSGLAVRRLQITATAPGGHSWLHFGRPSAVHGIVQLGAQIASMQPPTSPRTTFNIGMIEGGTTINAIATSASLWLDLRSEDDLALRQIEQTVRRAADSLADEELQFSIDVVGERPSGSIPADHWLVVLAQEALSRAHLHATLENGSTDANIPLSEGIPAVTIGITRGGNAHRPDEFIEVSPILQGIEQLMTLIWSASRRIAQP